ncbi:MAG: biopolymer transporter ExbD [Deltaproteobacteria bacterium]|nr:biopolymer transporter ExbD [Deltaproteobacteria bacterium]
MQFLKEQEEDVGLSLTSLIDVIFLLLIFFIVTTTLIDPTKKLEIQLPEAKAASPDSKSMPVTIELGRRGAVTLNGKAVKLNTLERRLKELAKENRKKSAIVRADRRLDYGQVVKVLGICRASGFLDIGIAVK